MARPRIGPGGCPARSQSRLPRLLDRWSCDHTAAGSPASIARTAEGVRQPCRWINLSRSGRSRNSCCPSPRTSRTGPQRRCAEGGTAWLVFPLSAAQGGESRWTAAGKEASLADAWKELLVRGQAGVFRSCRFAPSSRFEAVTEMLDGLLTCPPFTTPILMAVERTGMDPPGEFIMSCARDCWFACIDQATPQGALHSARWPGGWLGSVR